MGSPWVGKLGRPTVVSLAAAPYSLASQHPMPPSLPNAAAAAAVRWAGVAARLALGIILGAWSLLLIAWLTLHWGILPHAEQWRPQIEHRASRALGVPVRIGNIEVRSRGWIPAVELTDVVLHDRDGREALRLPRVAAAVSARSLLTLQLRFEQLLIDGARLEVRRDTSGSIHVAGLEMSAAPGDDGALADWFFEQHEFVIRNGALRWSDEQRNAPPLELTGVELVVRNGLRRHDLRLDATPPAEWGERFSLRARLTQPLLARSGDWRRWNGTLHAELPRADVSELRRHVDLPFELTGGAGALRAWIDVVQGEARGATVDIALREVVLRLARDLEPLAFEQVNGRLAAVRHDRGFSVAAQRFGFVTADGVTWPRGELKLAVRQADDGAPVDGGEFSADRLDLALMARVAERVPLGAALRKLLTELAPQGVVLGLNARWDGPLDAPLHYQVKTRVKGLTIAAAPASAPDAIGRPGWRNADIDLNASDKGGDARLVLDGGALEFPGVFDDPVLPLDQFSAQLAWRIEKSRRAGALPQLELKVSHARFVNADAQGELSATWRTGTGTAYGRGGRYPGVLELAGKLAGARAAAVARYLPRRIPQSARSYVERAVLDGRIAAATFKVRGDLSDFPYSNVRDGEFRVAGKVDGVTLAYVPAEPGHKQAWPAFTRVSGELVFDRASMEIRNAQARLWDIELAKVNGTIRDLDHSVLVIDGQVRGPAADLVRYVNATPVGEWTHEALKHATFGGSGDLKLALTIPLADVDRASVKGSIALAGNDVRIRPDAPLMAGAKARIEFSDKGFSIAGGSARVLGGEASFEGGTGADGTLRFTGQGVATADGLRREAGLGWLSRLATSFSGQTPYRMTLAVVRGHPEITLTSSLGGLGVDLPAPLKKAAADTLPMRYASSVLPDVGGAPRDQLRFELGSALQAQFMRDLSRDEPQVLRGGIGVGEAAPTPAAGVHANVVAASFNADAWQSVLDRVTPSGATGAVGAAADAGGYLPKTVAFRAQELVTGSRRLSHVVAGLTHEDTRWRANVEADQLNGYVEWHPGRGTQPGVIYARLARLSLPQAQAESVESLLDQAPTSAPALDIVVDDFDLRGKKLGRVEIEAANREGAQWRLTKLSLITPDARLTGTGQWSAAAAGAARRRMEMDFQLELADSGAFLERMGLGRALRGGRGRLQGQLSWSGSPLALHVPSLAGQMNLSVDKGQFLKAGPGAARLLSVLSLQSLPRRLVLDFRDVFQEGFPFDNASGDITIHQGVASTNNLRMRGVQAAVLMEGQADLERETQDLRVIVVPEINAGTASLAYAAINPAIGLTTFVAQLLLRKPLMAAGTREFHVGGSWDEPKVDRVERKPGAPLPDLDPAPAAAAASAPVRNE